MAMQDKAKTIVACVIVAAVGLLAAPRATATGSSCSSFQPAVRVISHPVDAAPGVTGPCPVTSVNPTECAASGAYTGIQYEVTGGAQYVAALATADNVVVSGGTRHAACVGDPYTQLGKQSCHEQAISFGCTGGDSFTFWVVVEGKKDPIPQSVAARRGYCVKSVAVAGLGLDAPAAPVTETLQHGACAVEFTLNALTGTVLGAKLTPESPESCSLITGSVENLELKLGDTPLGFAQFGNGYVQSGTASCTTRIIGGRVYTWGSPCPE